VGTEGAKMKFTLIFKVPNSAGQLPVPLAASMDDEKDANGELERYKGQAKKIMRQTSTTSPSPCTIEVSRRVTSRGCVLTTLRLRQYPHVRLYACMRT
jgi:hypothetical protein